jgi:hypothetical protein
MHYGNQLQRARGHRVAAGVGAVALAIGLGAGLSPARAMGNGHYETIVCHCRTMAEANTLQADAQRLGYRAVIQVIHPTDIEVELVNGLQTKTEADRFCAQEQPKLDQAHLHCHAEQEMHGIPSGWTQNPGSGGASGGGSTTTTSSTTTTTAPKPTGNGTGEAPGTHKPPQPSDHGEDHDTRTRHDDDSPRLRHRHHRADELAPWYWGGGWWGYY